MPRPEPTSMARSAADFVAALTPEQKAALTSGATFWTTKAIEDAGIPAILLTDGPARGCVSGARVATTSA